MKVCRQCLLPATNVGCTNLENPSRFRGSEITRVSHAVLFFLLFLFHVAVFAAPQTIQYTLRVWQTDDGLPHNYVQAITQTQQGDLWVGTLNGLARFDGIHFTIYEPGNTPSMNNGRINALLSARDGSLWIGGGIGMLLQYKNGVFISHNQAAALSDNPVLTFYEARDGSIWIGARDGARQFKNGKFQHFSGEGALRSTVRQICEDLEGNVFLATGAGLALLRDGVLKANYVQASGLPSGVLRGVCADREGYIWVASMAGLSKMKNGAVVKNYLVADGLADNTVSALWLDQRNQLWIGTFNGLNRLVNDDLITESTQDRLPFDSVYAFFEDREGNLWIGTRDGLCRLNPKQFFTFTQQHGLSRNNVISVLESRAGEIWIGTWGGGINRLRDDQVDAYLPEKPKFGDLILSLCEDHRGDIWFGTDYQNGLFRFSEGNYTHYGAESGLTADAVRVIFEDRKTNLWVGANNVLHRLEGTQFKKFTKENGMTGGVIRALFEDHEGVLWIGTSTGLNEFRNGSFRSRKELSGETVYAIYEDLERTLWFGTRRQGLNRLRAGKLSAYTKRDGLFSDEIFEVLEDDDGWLWMSCLKGIFRVNKKELDEFDRGKISTVSCISYGRSDGMDSATCVGTAKPAGWKGRDGRLWFPTTKGIVVTDPQLGRKANDQPPPIVIEKIVADKKPLAIEEEEKSRGEKSVSRPYSLVPVRLPPGRGELEFEFSALSYRAPEKNRFRYKLEGVDSDWIEAGTRRSAHYNNILPGDYRFRVIGCNNDGVWNQLGASVNLTLLPHFWQTWWFKMSLGFAAVLVVAGVYGIREGQRRQIEKLRLRLAADLHDEVGSNLGSISLLSRMLIGAENLSEEQRSDLSLMNRVSKETANSIKDIVWFTNPQFDTLHDLVKRMEDVAKTLLTGLECDFVGHSDDPDRKLSLEFRQNVFLIFKETLANILKHSRATHVKIEASQSEESWQMRIADNGSGFDLEKVEQGNGLVNLRRRAARMGGNLKIQTNPGQGTTILFSAPLQKRRGLFSRR